MDPIFHRDTSNYDSIEVLGLYNNFFLACLSGGIKDILNKPQTPTHPSEDVQNYSAHSKNVLGIAKCCQHFW